MLSQLTPLALLLLTIALVVRRLPRPDLGHSDAFRRRRVGNWLPLGLTYAALYMGRYNLNVLKDIGVLGEEQYGTIFGLGAMVYGLSFLLNGPLTDRYGGRRTMLVAAAGSALANLLMGVAVQQRAGVFPRGDTPTTLALLYGANMYFQSFGAVAIVKVNAAWFHVRERGVFGGIFGILISLGIYFAFDWGLRIGENMAAPWVFWLPGAALLGFWALSLATVRDTPSQAGHRDFHTGDATADDSGPRAPVRTVLRQMARSKVIVTIALIELCSGYLRNAIMHWYRDFAKAIGTTGQFVYQNWGLLLCVAGILGGMFAGVISDRLFQSRRGPVATVLYALLLLGAIAVLATLESAPAVGWIVVFMSMSVIGVHGMLSGTASQDFGGTRNAGIAVGILDGCVYLGTTAQSLLLGHILPARGTPEASQLHSWAVWPVAMAPVALIGLLLALRVWHATPQGSTRSTRR
jgi:OPA family glycerol-3-phosphate transporter-like MFS transporter